MTASNGGPIGNRNASYTIPRRDPGFNGWGAGTEGGIIKAEKLAVTSGINADRALRLREIEKKPGGNVHHRGPVVIVVNADRPNVAEAEVVEASMEGEAQEVAGDSDGGVLR